METISVTDPIAISRAVEVLQADGVVLYPTDTLYGLGVDAMSNDAVDRVYAIKGRDEHKPIHAIASSLEMVERYAIVEGVGRALAQQYWPGALSVIFKKRDEVVGGIACAIDTIGFRVPDNQFCLELGRAFGAPITTTSANRAGAEPERSAEAILAQLGEAVSLIDLVIDGGELPFSIASTLVDVSQGKIKVLREGKVIVLTS
jgi:L-threonylcarbamoyladenylate synthase